MSVHAGLAVAAVVAAVMAPGAALAYIGPGAGLGMIGSLVAVVGAVLLAIVGLLVLPFRMLARAAQGEGCRGRQTGDRRRAGSAPLIARDRPGAWPASPTTPAASPRGCCSAGCSCGCGTVRAA